ncbi:integrase-like protein, partial [Kineococcus rhizosphaerae]
FTATRPNELWLTGITEHPTAEGKLYLCAIKDMFSRRIVGYSIDSRMTSRLAVRALANAVAQRRVEGFDVTGCTLHSDRGSQGGFNWSSQHPRPRRCTTWSRPTGPRRPAMSARACAGSGVLIGRYVRLCGPRDGLSRHERYFDSSGGSSPPGSPPPMLPPELACPGRSESAGSDTLAGCRRSVLTSPPDATCPSLSGRRSRCFAPRGTACARSPAGSGETPARSLENYGATPPPAAADQNIAPRWRSGKPSRPRSDPRPPSSSVTTGCASTCKTGSPAASADSTVLPSPAPAPRRGRDSTSPIARTDAGRWLGARSRSLTASRWTSPMMSPCVSAQKRSTSRCSSKDAVR